MDIFSVVLFLVLYYLRPQEWGGIFSSLRPAKVALILALVSLLQREKKLRLRDFFITPHDWIVAAFFLWTIIASPAHWKTAQTIQSQIVLYFVVVQALSSIERMKKVMGWWVVMILMLSALAISSEYGFDPFGSYDVTHGSMKDRLILNLSIFSNPNALAHSVVPVIPMLYFLMFWKKMVSKPMILLLALPVWCIFLTQSKGAFLCGFVTLLATLTFGRPKAVQVLIVVLAAGFGYGALYMLPRMNELNKSKTDAAIQGRIAAYTHGLECMRTNFFGIGLGNFEEHFFRYGPLEYPEHNPHRMIRVGDQMVKQVLPKKGHHYHKATHGVYNQTGAELGRIGLFLHVGVLYCCLRTLMTAKTANTEEERVRRMLFALILSYAVSSWMVDFTYRPTFFMMVAATAAFHRHLRRGLDDVPEESTQTDAAPAWRPALQPVSGVPGLAGQPMPALAMAGGGGDGGRSSSQLDHVRVRPMPSFNGSGAGQMEGKDEPHEEEAEPLPVMKWNKIGLIDIGLIIAGEVVVIRYWIHLIHTM